MKHLRWWVVGLIVALVAFYNLERLSFGQERLLDIEWFLYTLTLVAVISAIVFRVLRRLPAWGVALGWLFIYFIGTMLLSDARQAQAGPMYLYLMITESAALYILVWLACQVSRALEEFSAAVEQVTVPDADRWVIQLQDAHEAIETEINRSRRYERPLSVLCVRPDFDTIEFVLNRLVKEVQESIAHHYAIVNLGRMLKISMRRTDLILLEDRRQGCFIVLCPETDRAGATLLMERVKVFADEELGFTVDCGVSLFPEDALTFEEVVQQAERHAAEVEEHEQVADPIIKDDTA